MYLFQMCKRKRLVIGDIHGYFDTLKEMAEWLSSHPQDVTEMKADIEENAKEITGRADNYREYDEAKHYFRNLTKNAKYVIILTLKI